MLMVVVDPGKTALLVERTSGQIASGRAAQGAEQPMQPVLHHLIHPLDWQ
jgi:hypothetical protein